MPWLGKEYHLGPNAAAALVDYIREQQVAVGLVPDERCLLVESWRDELGRVNVIAHSPYGARINKTWGIALAARAKRASGEEWSVSASNDLLVLMPRETTTPTSRDLNAETLLGGVSRTSLLEVVKAGAGDAAAFGGSF